MAVTISLYNHTSARFADGSNAIGDTYKVMLCTAATFAATDTTLAGITKTEISNGGYVAGGAAMTGVAVTTAGNDAKWDANDVVWAATGTALSASFAIIYNDTDTNDPPVAFIDFDGNQTAGIGTEFKITWNAGGIFTFTVA